MGGKKPVEQPQVGWSKGSLKGKSGRYGRNIDWTEYRLGPNRASRVRLRSIGLLSWQDGAVGKF